MVFVPLYAGPFVAGLARADWPFVFVFGFIFAAFMARTRRSHRNSLLKLTLLYLTNVAVVAIVFGLGVAVSAVTGPIGVSPKIAVVICLSSAVFGAWRYRHSDEFDSFLDEAIATIETADLPDGDVLPQPDAELEEIFDSLSETDLSEARLNEIEASLRHFPDPELVADTLVRRSDHSERHLLLCLRHFARPDLPPSWLPDQDIYDLFDDVLEVDHGADVLQAALEFEAHWPDRVSPEAREEVERRLAIALKNK